MNGQISALLKFRKYIGVIAVSIIWSASASASLLTYDVTISDFYFAPHYTGVAIVDTDTHVLIPGSASTLGHIYNLSYDLHSTQNAQAYSGVGTLHLATLLDLHVNFDGFKNYLNEGSAPLIVPPGSGWVWHDANFDVSTLKSLYANETGSISPKSWITMTQVPEPSTFLLALTGLASFMFVRRRTPPVPA